MKCMPNVRGAWLLALSLALFVSQCAGSKVIDLTTANFEEIIAEGTWIIKFYAPWCGHCKRCKWLLLKMWKRSESYAVAPTYDKLAEALADEEDIFVAKVDGTENQGLSSRFGVRGFPSLFSVRDGEVRVYEGPRTLQKMKNFVLNGHKEVDPLAWHASPLGPIGKIKGAVVDSAMKLNTVHTMLQTDYGFSEKVASIIVIASIVWIVLVAMVLCLCGLAASQSTRGGQEGQHPHQD